MAINVHIACGFCGREGTPLSPQPLVRSLVWSETMQAPGVTSKAAPPPGQLGSPIFEIRASFDIYVAWGDAPDASKGMSTDANSARLFVPANTTIDIYGGGNDKVAWVAAT